MTASGVCLELIEVDESTLDARSDCVVQNKEAPETHPYAVRNSDNACSRDVLAKTLKQWRFHN